jgi:hypothetical protein
MDRIHDGHSKVSYASTVAKVEAEAGGNVEVRVDVMNGPHRKRHEIDQTDSRAPLRRARPSVPAPRPVGA